MILIISLMVFSINLIRKRIECAWFFLLVPHWSQYAPHALVLFSIPFSRNEKKNIQILLFNFSCLLSFEIWNNHLIGGNFFPSMFATKRKNMTMPVTIALISPFKHFFLLPSSIKIVSSNGQWIFFLISQCNLIFVFI